MWMFAQPRSDKSVGLSCQIYQLCLYLWCVCVCEISTLSCSVCVCERWRVSQACPSPLPLLFFTPSAYTTPVALTRSHLCDHQIRLDVDQSDLLLKSTQILFTLFLLKKIKRLFSCAGIEFSNPDNTEGLSQFITQQAERWTTTRSSSFNKIVNYLWKEQETLNHLYMDHTHQII